MAERHALTRPINQNVLAQQASAQLPGPHMTREVRGPRRVGSRRDGDARGATRSGIVWGIGHDHHRTFELLWLPQGSPLATFS